METPSSDREKNKAVKTKVTNLQMKLDLIKCLKRRQLAKFKTQKLLLVNRFDDVRTPVIKEMSQQSSDSETLKVSTAS